MPKPLTIAQKRKLLEEHPEVAWKYGILWYKLDSNQLKTYWTIRKALEKPFARYILNWARRTGKTYLLLLIAMEDAIRKRKARFNVAAATKESLKEFVWPTVELILEDCPERLRPHIQEGKGRVTFKKHPSQSLIVLAGCNDSRSVERLRGPRSNGNIIEEMGAIPEAPGLRYIMTGVLNPQTLTTGGWTLGATTPPKSAGHEAANIVLHAEAMGNYSYCTLYDNPRLTPQTIQAYLESDAAALGMTVEDYKNSIDYRREWLAIIETDPTLAVLPTFTDERAKKIVCGIDEEPVFVDRYVSMDIGFSPDWTGILYAYWSFERQRLRIVGERILRRMGTPELAAAIKQDEIAHFGRNQPFMRVADNNNPILLKDLALQFDLLFRATEKDDLRAAVADVCRWVANGTIEISEDCRMLRAQMRAAVWNSKGTEFERSKQFGHFDLVASLIYLVRNVIPNINRVPPHYGKSEETHFIRNKIVRTPEEEAILDIFGAANAYASHP